MKDSPYKKRSLWQWIVLYLFIGGLIYAGIYLLYSFFSHKKPYSSSLPYIQGTRSDEGIKYNPATVVFASNEGQRGVAMFEEVRGNVVVTLSSPDISRDGKPAQAFIRLGTCQQTGVAKYTLSPIVNGASVTRLHLTFSQLKKENPFVVEVHSGKLKKILFCGESASLL